MRIGLLGSFMLHAGFLFWGLVTFPEVRPFVVVQSAGLPVDLVPIESLTRLQKGETVQPKKPPSHKRVTSVSDSPAPEKKTPPRPAKTARLAKAEPPAKTEVKTEKAPPPLPQKQALPPTPEPSEKTPPPPAEAVRSDPSPPPPSPSEKVPEKEPKKEKLPPKAQETQAQDKQAQTLEAPSSGPAPAPEAAPAPKKEEASSESAPSAELALLETSVSPAPRPARPTPPPQETKDQKPPEDVSPSETAQTSEQQQEKKETKKEAEFDPNSIAALLNKVTPSGERSAVAQEEGTENVSQLGTRNAPDMHQVSLSQSEVDALKAQISACWSPPVGALAAENVVVVMRVFLEPDGSLFQPPELVNAVSHPLFEAMADSARRALLMCQPYQLPRDKYEAWNTATITFDLREMLGG